MEGHIIRNDLTVLGIHTIEEELLLGLSTTVGTNRTIEAIGSGSDIDILLLSKGAGVLKTRSNYDVDIADNEDVINLKYHIDHLSGKSVSSLLKAPTPTEDFYSIVWDDTNQVYTLVDLGGGITADSGLTKTVSNIQLGGSLLHDTDITGAFAINFGLDGDKLTNFKVRASALMDIKAQGNTQLITSSTNSIQLIGGSVSSYVMINDDGAPIIRDNQVGVNQRGLRGYHDYSANINANDYTQKVYVDAHIVGQNISPVLASPGVAQHGYVISWDNTNSRFSLVAQTGGGGGGSGHIIEYAGTPLTQRANLNILNGLTAVDNDPDTDIKWGGSLSEPTIITGTTSNTLKFVFNNLGVTATDGAGIWLANTTAAAAGAQQYSPSLVLEGQGWKTNATAESQSVKVRHLVVPVQGAASPAGRYYMQYSINEGTWFNVLTYTSTGGQLSVPSNIASENGALVLRSVGTYSPLIGNGSNTNMLGALVVSNQNNYNIVGGSGSIRHLSLSTNVVTTSGTYTVDSIYSGLTINLTGATKGQVTGINLNQTFTLAQDVTGYDWNPVTPANISGTHIAYRATSGGVVFGHTTLTAGTTRLQVRGTGTTTNISALFEDSTGSSTFFVQDNGNATLRSSLSITSSGGSILFNGTVPIIFHPNTTLTFRANVSSSATNPVWKFTNNGGSYTNASGTTTLISTEMPFAPTSGTGIINAHVTGGVVNQTGGANGQITYYNITPSITAAVNVTGFDWNPTTPANISGTHIAFRATSGSVLLGDTTVTPNYRLDVRGIAGGNIVRFANDSNTRALSIRNSDGLIEIGSSSIGFSRSNSSYISNSITGTSLAFTSAVAFSASGFRFGFSGAGAIAPTFAGTLTTFNIGAGETFAPSSGTTSLITLAVAPNYNTTGTYVGALIGIDYNPAITAVVGATHYAFRATSGQTLLGGTSVGSYVGPLVVGIYSNKVAMLGNLEITSGSNPSFTGVGIDVQGTNRTMILRSAGFNNASDTYSLQITTTTAVNRAGADLALAGILYPTVASSTFTANSLAMLKIAGTGATLTTPLTIQYGIDYTMTAGNAGTHIGMRIAEGQILLGHTTVVANNKVGIRGMGTTTGLTLLLEDSAGTDRFGFTDAGVMYHYTAPANDDALTQVLVRDSGTGEIKYRTSTTLGGGHVIENNGTPLTQRANLNFTNGLTALDNAPDTNVELGGTITKNTIVDNNGFNLQLGANAASRARIAVFDSIAFMESQLASGSITFSADRLNNYASINYSNGSNSVSIRLNTTGIRLGDAIASLGAYYNANYATAGTANDRWLPDWGAVKGAKTFTARQTFFTSTTGSASFNVPHGVAPTTPVNGDFWTTTAGAFIRINGSTVSLVGSSAGSNNEVQVSNGSGGFVASKFFFDNSAGTATIGDSGLAGAYRSVLVDGSAASIGLYFKTKGTSGDFRVDTNNGISVFDISTAQRITIRPYLGIDNEISFAGYHAAIGVEPNNSSYRLRIYGGNGASGNNNGGDIYIKSGDKAGSGLHGNIAFHITPSVNFQLMERGIFIADATANPTGNPTGGGFLYSDAGDSNKLKWRVPGGTTYDLTASGGGSSAGVTNELQKNNGSSGFAGTGLLSSTEGDLVLGLSTTTGTTRALTADGSSTNISVSIKGKNSGTVSILTGDADTYLALSHTNITTYLGASTGVGLQTIRKNSATNSVIEAFRGLVESTGTAANGIGASLVLGVQISSVPKLGSIIESVMTDVTNASEDFNLVFKTMAGGATAATRLTLNNTVLNAASGVKVQENGVNISPIGKQDIFIPASAMWPKTTNGCSALAKSEITTSLVNVQYLEFSGTTDQYAQFSVQLPRNWDLGTVTFKAHWYGTAGSGTVIFTLKGGAYSHDDPLTGTMGTAQSASTTLTATNDKQLSARSSAITISNSPTSEDFIMFEIMRDTASDTNTSPARLLGITIEITTNAAVAA